MSTHKVVHLKIRNAHDDVFSEALAVGPRKSWLLILAPWASGPNTAPAVLVVPTADQDKLWITAGGGLEVPTYRMAEDGVEHIVRRTRETTLAEHGKHPVSDRRTVKGKWRGVALITPAKGDRANVEVRLERRVSPYATLVVTGKSGDHWEATVEFKEGWWTKGAGATPQAIRANTLAEAIVNGLRSVTKALGSVCWFRDSRLRAAYDSDYAQKRPIKAPPPFKPNADELVAGAFTGLRKKVTKKPAKAPKVAKPKAAKPKAPKVAKAPRGKAAPAPKPSVATKAPRGGEGKGKVGKKRRPKLATNLDKSAALTSAISGAIGARLAAVLGS